MKKVIKKSLAILCAFVMLSGTITCFAAELNQDAVDLHYGQYKNYLLLGDSVASGYRDEVTDDDAAFNEANYDSTYYRYPGSYSDVLANAIIEDGSMTALAGPGFRTIEMRYMLEDDYAANCTDEFLFWPSHLYIWQDLYGAEYAPGSEYWRTMFKESIAEADLITLGIGGNDWGAYLGWVVNQILKEENVGDHYIQQLQAYMAENELDLGSIEQFVEIAHMAGALPALLEKVPEALEYGLGNFYSNWDIMIQDIYDLNPDVTLMVIGMSDNSLKGNYYDYNGVAGAPVNGTAVDDVTSAMSSIVELVMSIGNKPMIDGAKKFGYTYVDTAGTTYVESHPDAAGHAFIANKIIEALPNPMVAGKYNDVPSRHENYEAIEYVIVNEIMDGTSDTTFGPDDALTTGALAAAVNKISGVEGDTTGTDAVRGLKFAGSILNASVSKGFSGFFTGLKLYFEIFFNYLRDTKAVITRAEAAYYFMLIDKI